MLEQEQVLGQELRQVLGQEQELGQGQEQVREPEQVLV